MAATPGSGRAGTMTEERPPSRASPVLLAAVTLALAVGAAASLIAGAARAPAFQAPPSVDLFLTPGQLSVVILLVLLVLIGLILWLFFGVQRAPVPGRIAVALVAIVLAAVLIAEFLRLFFSAGAGSGAVTSTNHSGGNGTGGGTNGTGPGNAMNPGGPLGFLTLHLPPWLLFVAVAIGALVVSAVAVPYLSRRAGVAETRRAPGPVNMAEIEAALTSAVRELDQGNDPRQVVIRLYSTLLARIGPMVGGVDEHTPEEIRARHLVRLGIRTEAATTLTRLFEEARYSSHPLGPPEADQARQAIADARDDLDRPRPAS